MAQVSESFYKSLATIVSVFIAGYLVNIKLTSTVKDTMEATNKPLIEKMQALEKKQEGYELKQGILISNLSTNSYRISATKTSLDRALLFFDKKFSTEFIKPDDIYYKTKESEGSND
jgi:hypothetical protein